MIITRPCRGSK